MDSSGPSQTAAGVALLRAVHQLVDGLPKILDDAITPQLLDPAVRQRLMASPLEYRSAEQMALRSHVVVRSRYAEDRLADAVARRVGQYLLLGAGLDTFAHRQPDWARELRIFEVDHPASQRWKRERLALARIESPDNLIYVAADFERDRLSAQLAKAGFDDRAPVFISCLGVLMYLREETVRTLLELAGTRPVGSELVFTYSSRGKESRLAAAAAALGEPWLASIAPDQWIGMLRQAGFNQIEMVAAEEIAARYFTGRADGLPAPRRGTIGVGVV
ncbi:MAG: class I SAM-dependent methyltransferase [Gemmatimonadota bacterium]